MSQFALARRYRPHTFQTMIGQEVALRALSNALDLKRLHHAYLFTGMHGVGKTSIARILAKCLNCEAGISSKPCDQCFACQAIDKGHFVDLIEVDAASRTKVEDTRDLLDNVQYLPTRGRFKIYLIDEVHMLSTHSFNALLKTLEEPPEHVKFLLATTDPQKLPATVLSRCLQFHLRPMPYEKIVDHLAHILHQEGISFEDEALQEIARAALGSVRDALSLLDQALNYSSGSIEAEGIRLMLGLSDKTKILNLLNLLANGDTRGLLREVHHLEETVSDFSGLLKELLEMLHQMAIAKSVPEALDPHIREREAILKLVKSLSPEEIQLYYQIGLQGQRDLPYAPNAKMGFEMTLLRMVAFQPVRVSSFMATTSMPMPASLPEVQTPSIVEPLTIKRDHHLPVDKPVQATADWNTIVNKLALTGLTKVMAENCVVSEWSDDFIQLILDDGQKPLFNKRYEERLREALCQYLGRTIRLKVMEGKVETETPSLQNKRLVAEATEATHQMIEVDMKIQKLIQAFDAKIEHVTLKENE